MMHNTKTGNKNNVKRHLCLISSKPNSPLTKQTMSQVAETADPRQITYLTVELMNRLWIPPTTTIVGLLNVGTSKDNFQELYWWIERQLNSSSNGGASDDLEHLERRLRDAVNSYPEM